AAGHKARDAATRISWIVGHIGKPTKRPLRANVVEREIGRLAILTLIIAYCGLSRGANWRIIANRLVRQGHRHRRLSEIITAERPPVFRRISWRKSRPARLRSDTPALPPNGARLLGGNSSPCPRMLASGHKHVAARLSIQCRGRNPKPISRKH